MVQEKLEIVLGDRENSVRIEGLQLHHIRELSIRDPGIGYSRTTTIGTCREYRYHYFQTGYRAGDHNGTGGCPGRAPRGKLPVRR